MDYLWKVWTIPKLQLSAIDNAAMALEITVFFFLCACGFALLKAYCERN